MESRRDVAGQPGPRLGVPLEPLAPPLVAVPGGVEPNRGRDELSYGQVEVITAPTVTTNRADAGAQAIEHSAATTPRALTIPITVEETEQVAEHGKTLLRAGQQKTPAASIGRARV